MSSGGEDAECLRRLLRLTRPYRGLAKTTLFSLVAVASWLVIPTLTKRLVDEAILGGRGSLVWPLALAALGFGSLQAFMIFLRRNTSGNVAVDIETDLRSRLFAHLQGLPVSFHQQWQTGQLLARATGDLNAVSSFLGNALAFLSFFLLTVLGVTLMLFRLDPPLAALTLGLVVPFVAIASRFSRNMRSVSTRSRQALGEVTSVVEDSVAGIRVIKAYGREEHVVARLADASDQLRSVNLESVVVRSFYVPSLALVPALAVAAVLGLGGHRVIEGSLTVGGLVAFNQYLALILNPLRFAGWHVSNIQPAMAAGRRVLQVLDCEAVVADAPGAAPLPPAGGEVRFESVGFTYPDTTKPALSELSLSILAGETVAIVGTSGSGKSTLAALLPRFADPTTGRVLVDGIDIRTVTLASLRRQVGTVFDEAMLFSASIHDNIAFGDPGASAERVHAAARTAGAHGFITALPDGYATLVGDRGMTLSGGQRQRIALARALLPDPPILVLDDPLSSVDANTEAEIEANLRALRQGRTTVLIAHRASTIAIADRVLLMDDGRVVAGGTHKELLRTNADYRVVLAAELRLDPSAVAEAGR